MAKKPDKSVRVIVLSDMHCGHVLGLTPPKWWNSYREIQSIGWKWFTGKLKQIGNIDVCIVNGDAVEGEGEKDSRQHIDTDTDEQVKIAIEVLKAVNAKKYIFLRGTPYHVTTDREVEDSIAAHFGSEIHDARKIDINGCVIHARHTTGKGGTAYGSITSLQRSAVVELLNDCINGGEKADIYIRSHIHEYNLVKRSLFTAITTPALQFKGTAYGRKCTGFIDYGFIWLDIRGKRDYDIHEEIPFEQKEEITRI